MDRLKCLELTCTSGDHVVGIGAPDEALGVSVVLVDKAANGDLKVDRSGTLHAADELGEGAFYRVEPGG